MSTKIKVIVLSVAGAALIIGAIAAAPALGAMVDGGGAGVQPAANAAPAEYPVNDAGETYGSPANGAVPDLIVAVTDDGDFGYVRVSEVDLERNLARSTTNPDAVFAVDVYESDGETVVGQFTVTADTPGARDGLNN